MISSGWNSFCWQDWARYPRQIYSQAEVRPDQEAGTDSHPHWIRNGPKDPEQITRLDKEWAKEAWTDTQTGYGLANGPGQIARLDQDWTKDPGQIARMDGTYIKVSRVSSFCSVISIRHCYCSKEKVLA